jgi:predicted NBD/HSP70 family sugar kinase
VLELVQMGQQYYLGIDVGATKTLLAVFEPTGEMVCEEKIKTNPDYEQFKLDIAGCLKEMSEFKFSYACCAVPGWIDFKYGIAVSFGNLPWQNIHIKKDLEELLPGTQILIHNDAKLAGLSEALIFHDKYRKVLYLTISTGIGGGIIIDDVIDPNFANFEPGQMQFEYQGKSQKWENFASGKALHDRTGQLASELEDLAAWKEFAGLIAIGLEELLATVQPEVVVFGGGAGGHFERFKSYLEADLKAIKNPLVPVPPLIKAQRPEEAVIYGCYDYIKQNAG